MNTKKKRFLTILITLVMLIGLLPSAAFAADTIVTHDADYIRQLLRNDGDVNIRLDGDAEKELTAYADFEKHNEHKWHGDRIWTTVGSGSKSIDLNGHRIYIYDRSAKSFNTANEFRYIQGALLMEIPEGASLEISDKTGNGKIWMDAEMPDREHLCGNGMLMERNIFAVTGGELTVNSGEIHAGRAKEIYSNGATEYGADYGLVYDAIGMTKSLYGYATWFLSGSAITVDSGNVTINGGEIWGRGWDNWTLITRIPGAPNGADDFRDRNAALRVNDGDVTVNAGNFYGRSDADAVQVSKYGNLTIKSGTFDLSTNSWLVIPNVDLGYLWSAFRADPTYNAHQGSLGSFGVPEWCVDGNSDAAVSGDGKTMTVFPIGSGKTPRKTVSDVGIYINSPIAYATPANKASDVYNMPDGCSVDSIKWYKDGKLIENAESTYFEEGASYYVKIALTADEGAKFKYGLSDVYVNGKEAELYRKDDGHIVLTAQFGKCIAAIESLDFYAVSPKGEFYPDYLEIKSNSNDYSVIGGFDDYTEVRNWFVSDDGETGWTKMNPEDAFIVGKYYRLSFEVKAEEGQEFAVDSSGVSIVPDVTATVNGKKATVSKIYEEDPARCIAVEVDLGKCPAVVQHIELNVTAPKEGEKIKYTVTCADASYHAIGSEGNYTNYRHWYESDTGYDNWTEMTPGDTFKAGKYYKFATEICTNSGYVFNTYDDGTGIMPNVGAWVNGYGARELKTYEQDPSKYITVEFFFGICNDSVIEEVSLDGVIEPAIGEVPVYDLTVLGSGYRVDTSQNKSYDAYWATPPAMWPYLKNGISWYDETAGDYVYSHQTFIPGHSYRLTVYLITDDGYTFTNKYEHDALPTAYVNGNAAEIVEGWSDQTSTRVTYTFTCSKKEVNTIKIYDLEAPKAGNTPDTAVTSADPDTYVVDSVRWLNVEDGEVEGFEKGELYKVEIVVSAKDYSGTDACTFADEVTAYIDDKEVAGYYNKVTTNNDNTVTIRYEFRNPASAPEGEEVYAIGFVANGGTGTMAYVGSTGEYTLPDCEFKAPAGYGFKAWAIGSTGGEQKQPGETITINAETSIYAIWEELPLVMVSYADNGGSGSMIGDMVEIGGEFTLEPCEFIAPDGKQFKAWAIGSVGGEQKQPGETIIINAETYIYAIWEDAPVAIIYGDVNADGEINAKDNAFLSRYLAKWSGYGEDKINKQNADVDDNGSITAKDNAVLARHLANWLGYNILPYKK